MKHFIVSINGILKDRDLILGVVDSDGLHLLEFRCVARVAGLMSRPDWRLKSYRRIGANRAWRRHEPIAFPHA